MRNPKLAHILVLSVFEVFFKTPKSSALTDRFERDPRNHPNDWGNSVPAPITNDTLLLASGTAALNLIIYPTALPLAFATH